MEDLLLECRRAVINNYINLVKEEDDGVFRNLIVQLAIYI